MDAEAEAQVLAGVGAVDVEVVGVLEEPWVAVGGAREKEDARTGRDVDPGERCADAGHAELAP